MGTAIPALIAVGGVALGAAMQFIASLLTERSKWARTHGVRWDERRLEAYSAFSTAVKRLIDLNQRIAKTRGLASNNFAVDVEEGLRLLDAAEAERGAKWEAVLLLGSPSVIDAGRAWQQSAWTLYFFSIGEREGADEFKKALGDADRARTAFYTEARRDLNVPQTVPGSPWLMNYFRARGEN